MYDIIIMKRTQWKAHFSFITPGKCWNPKGLLRVTPFFKSTFNFQSSYRAWTNCLTSPSWSDPATPLARLYGTFACLLACGPSKHLPLSASQSPIHTHIETHIHSQTVLSTPPARWEQSGSGALLRDTSTFDEKGPGIRTSSLLLARRPAVPPEHLLPQTWACVRVYVCLGCH